MKSMRRTVKKILLALAIAIALPIFIFFIHWGSSLVRCEILTEIHREGIESFFESDKGKECAQELIYFKVLDVDGRLIKVFFERRFYGEAYSRSHYLWLVKLPEGYKFFSWGDNFEGYERSFWPYWYHNDT